MNRRGASNLAMDTIIPLIVVTAVFAVMIWFVNSYSHGSAFYEDFYAKEIANVINNAEPGMEFKIDITPLASLAVKSGKPIRDLVYIDNVNNKVIVSTRLNTGTSFNFFNNVDVLYLPPEGPSGGVETTRFIFKIVEKQRGNEA